MPEPTLDQMTLRDLFALFAFHARISNYRDWTLDELTEQAFTDADALLRAREVSHD